MRVWRLPPSGLLLLTLAAAACSSGPHPTSNDFAACDQVVRYKGQTEIIQPGTGYEILASAARLADDQELRRAGALLSEANRSLGDTFTPFQRIIDRCGVLYPKGTST